MGTPQQQGDLDGPTSKMVNYISSLKTKADKQADEIAKLKGELSKAKTSNSRIRRIPKKEEEKPQEAVAVA